MSDLISKTEALIKIRGCYPSLPIFKKNRKAWQEKYEGYIKAYEIIQGLPTVEPKDTLLPSGELLVDTRHANEARSVRLMDREGFTRTFEEPKTGHWIGTEYDGYADGHPVYDVYECSECGMEYDAIDDGEITHNYCPNCGAKMERSKE